MQQDNYKESIFFEYLSTLDKKYIFINTKEILSKNLENSEIDWSKYQPNQTLVLKPKKQLRDHQKSCYCILLKKA